MIRRLMVMARAVSQWREFLVAELPEHKLIHYLPVVGFRGCL